MRDKKDKKENRALGSARARAARGTIVNLPALRFN
jgi:hypothetical protein